MRFKFFERWMHGSRELADDFIHSGIDAWAAEGHFTQEEASDLRDALSTPEVSAVTANLGAHLAMSIPLRFPLGSLARFLWTLVARIRVQWPAIRGDQAARRLCTIHTVPVMLLGLVPGFGAGAYLLSEPLRDNRALPAIILDRLLRKVPMKLYERLHLVELTTWWAQPPRERRTGLGLRPLLTASRERISTLRSRWRLIAAVLTLNALALASATYLRWGLDASWAFSEFGLINSLDAGQLLVAGVLGVLSFRSFWRGPSDGAAHATRAGIFLWGAVGLGLILFAFDDFFGVHERLGVWIARNTDVLPMATNNADDIMTLMYGVAGLIVLAVFRHELFEARTSSALLIAGVLAAGLMLGTDAFAVGFIKVLEFPAQVGAVALLLLASTVRYVEVHAARPRALERAVTRASTG